MSKNKVPPSNSILSGTVGVVTSSNNINLSSDGSLLITGSKIAIDGHIDTIKISKLIHILCAGDLDKIKTVIEADIDRELSNNLISINSFDETYLIHLFKVYLQTFPSLTYDDQNTEIFETISKKILKRSFISRCLTSLEDSSLKISHPTIYAEIKQNLNKVKELLPNSIDFIKESSDEEK